MFMVYLFNIKHVASQQSALWDETVGKKVFEHIQISMLHFICIEDLMAGFPL